MITRHPNRAIKGVDSTGVSRYVSTNEEGRLNTKDVDLKSIMLEHLHYLKKIEMHLSMMNEEINDKDIGG